MSHRGGGHGGHYGFALGIDEEDVYYISDNEGLLYLDIVSLSRGDFRAG